MKKVRRIIALIGAIALVALYVSTLVLALIGSEQTLTMLMAAVFSTIVLPVLIWAYTFIYNLLHKYYTPEGMEETEKMRAAMRKAAENEVEDDLTAGEAPAGEDAKEEPAGGKTSDQAAADSDDVSEKSPGQIDGSSRTET